MSSITIVAGGWSASQFNLAKLPGTIIAVNDSAHYLPRWDICLSMDRMWAEARVESLRRLQKPIWLRASTLKNVLNIRPIVPFECDHTSTIMAERAPDGAPHRLNGTHSGFCALNLAYQMRPRAIFLVGFDMALGPRGERHWFPDYAWKNGGGSSGGKLAEWSGQFEPAAQQFLAAQIVVSVAGKKGPRWFRPIDRKTLEREAACAA